MPLSLVYHAGALGDFITTLPAMEGWRRLHAKDRIVLLGRPELAGLAREGLFNEAWDARSSLFAPLFGAGPDPESPVTSRFSGFVSALLFCVDSSLLPLNLSRLGVREIVRQDPFPPQKAPIVDYHLSLFPGLFFSEEDRRPGISRGTSGLTVPPHAVSLHPGSGDPRKNWPLSRFLGLAELLQSSGLRVQWVVGPAEENVAMPVGARVWRSAPLEDLAAAFRRCLLYVGNDSGVAHLAASAGCPTVALFGASDPEVWAPRGKSVQVVAAPDGRMGSLSVETVFSACQGLLRKLTFRSR
ncbi:MAG: glycosyltransferase family 9 protein [Spirochaetia bacterium]|jgi:ADP-heptose:LPS heptosyltransferase